MQRVLLNIKKQLFSEKCFEMKSLPLENRNYHEN